MKKKAAPCNSCSARAETPGQFRKTNTKCINLLFKSGNVFPYCRRLVERVRAAFAASMLRLPRPVGQRFRCWGPVQNRICSRSKYEFMSAQKNVMRFVSDNTSRPTFCKYFNIPGATHLSPQNAYHWQCRVVTWCVTDSATDEPQHKDAAVVIQVLNQALTISRGPSASGRAAKTILGATRSWKHARNCRGQKSMREARRHKQTLKYRSLNGQS